MGYRLGDYHVICGDTEDNTITETAVSGAGLIIGSGNTMQGAGNVIIGYSNDMDAGLGCDWNLLVGRSHAFEAASSDRNLMVGFSNQISGGADSCALIGGNNTATNNYTTCIGSGNNDAYGASYGLLAGRSNQGTISGYYAQMISHSGTCANGYYQFITGVDASGNMQGGHTHSSGKFDSQGDAQYSIGCFGAQTTDGTQTTLTAMNDFDTTK